MKICFLVFAILFISASAWGWPGTVLAVHDGDTVTVAPGGDVETPVTVRLYGVDAPELNQPGGDAARTWLAGQLPAGTALEVIPYGVDRYGRTVGLLQSGPVGRRQTLNGELVAVGHAWVEPGYCRARFCREWGKLEARARSDQLGLWSDESPVRPSAWRKQHKAQ